MPFSIELYGGTNQIPIHLVIDRDNLVFLFNCADDTLNQAQKNATRILQLNFKTDFASYVSPHLKDTLPKKRFTDKRHFIREHVSGLEEFTDHFHKYFSRDVKFSEVKTFFEKLPVEILKKYMSIECRDEILAKLEEYFFDLNTETKKTEAQERRMTELRNHEWEFRVGQEYKFGLFSEVLQNEEAKKHPFAGTNFFAPKKKVAIAPESAKKKVFTMFKKIFFEVGTADMTSRRQATEVAEKAMREDLVFRLSLES